MRGLLEKKEGSFKDAERWETTKEGTAVSGGVIAAALRKSKTGHSDERWMRGKKGVESGGNANLCVQNNERASWVKLPKTWDESDEDAHSNRPMLDG